ncbi:MAG: family 20 glycosylhydrolase [Opitutaceae bacterium]|jgi:hypothetical protein
MIRSFQWDLARQVERLDWLLAQIPLYAEWGYEELHLNLEDAVEYPSLPGIARTDAYTTRQMEKLVATASRHGVRVVPIVNLLGHTQYLIKHPDLRDLNELRAADGRPLEHGQICPLHPRTLEVAGALMRDMAPFCTAGKIHVGLDESFQLGRHPLSREEIARIGLAAHFSGYAGKLNRLASELGLKMGIWADMLALLPEAIPMLPSGITAYDWYYYSFSRHPRMELRNFAEYDIEPALRAQGLSYWGCPMNGAFRYEPMPVFGDRLANIRSWWTRAKHVNAEGFLISSWESYRLAQEMTTVVDAAAACLWLDPEVEDSVEMLARGFARVFGHAHSRRWARQALACDERAFSGYARWEINDRWDCTAPREGYRRYAAEERFLTRLATHDLPEPFAASVSFREYLAKRDVFVRRSTREVLQLRRMLARHGGEGFSPKTWSSLPELAQHVESLRKSAHAFATEIREGEKAARAMWARTRDQRRRGQNEILLEADLKRLATWERWLARLARRPAIVWQATPVIGAWQLQFTVHNFAPALQRVAVEELQNDGAWRELHGRYTIEFRSSAARPHSPAKKEFSVPISAKAATSGKTLVRIAVRGLGQVAISHVEASNGVRHLRSAGWHARDKRLLGEPAPKEGFPEIDMGRNRGEAPLAFLL